MRGDEAVSGFRLLTRTFLRRFFDNEITGGTGDLRNSFFWMLAFLAVPGLTIPVFMTFDWTGYAIVHGPEGLRIASRADKVFYLGYSVVATGLVSAVTWGSLLLDYRDCLVLGTLPVAGQRIVRAKLLALLAYIVIVIVGMHALASMSYGFFLAERAPLTFAWRGIVAHFVASCAASAFVLLTITGAQGLALSVLGARRFSNLSPWMQSSVVVLVLLLLLALPAISTATVDSLASAGGQPLPRNPHVALWILRTPPVWFVGLYEVVLGTNDPVLWRLAFVALAALASAAVVTATSYPLAYRRLVSSVMQAPAPRARHDWLMRAIDGVVSHLGRRPAIGAAATFLALTLRRSMPHRLAFALALGFTMAMVSPTLFEWAPRLSDLPAVPTVELLSIPFRLLLGVLLGVRVAAALPSDLPSGWMLNSIGISSRQMRSGLWRLMFLTALCVVASVTPVYAFLWGATLALRHAALCLVFAVLLIEALLWGFDAMPCSRPWHPERANIRKWWPAYLVGFALVTRGLPALELDLLPVWTDLATFAAVLTAAALTLRVLHYRRRPVPEEDPDELVHVQVLNLD